MIAAQWFAIIVGAVLVALTLGSALRTVVVPGGQQVLITRTLFTAVRWGFAHRARLARTPQHRTRVLARLAPTGLMLLPLLWSSLVGTGCALMFWGFDADRSWSEAFALSGSSLTTLGFRTAGDFPSVTLSIFEALLGLGIMALLISFLPTMYSAFSTREASVAKLFIRVNGPEGVPDQAAMFIRWWQIGAFDRMPELWSEWEDWFVSIGESHTSFPALAFFRSPVASRSWITAAGLALDQASIVLSAINITRDPRAQLMIRTGTLALREVADYFGIEHDPDPAPTDPVSVTREEFLEVYERIASAGVPVRPDRDGAWRDFQGWRVNYDTVLLELCAMTQAPPAPWSSDRVAKLHDSRP